MILTLIAIISVGVLSVMAFNLNSDKWGDANDTMMLVSLVSFACSIVALFIYMAIAICYISAGYKADLINKEYGTNYTQAELFYASDVIEEIRQLQRKRIEINGNLMSGEREIEK